MLIVIHCNFGKGMENECLGVCAAGSLLNAFIVFVSGSLYFVLLDGDQSLVHARITARYRALRHSVELE
jgi:hypothetical protein